MHVLIIPSERYVPQDSPLEGIFQQHQARALKKTGLKVGVLSPPELWSIRLVGRVLDGHPNGTKVEEIDGIPVFRYYGWIPPRISQSRVWLWFWLRAGRSLYQQYVTNFGSPDVIHAHNARYAGILAWRIKQDCHVPYVLTEHSTEYARNLIRDTDFDYIASAFRNADKRIVVSPGLGRVLEKTIGDSVTPWLVIPNILDGKFENLNLGGTVGRKRDKDFHFLNVGILAEKKGQADLLRAFAARFREDKQVKLRIGGDGQLRQSLEDLSDQLDIGNQISFLGELRHEQVLEEMQNCDAYVHSSHYETFGVVIIEALACGKPVVSTICGGPEDIIQSHNGMLVPARDIDSLGNAMAIMRHNAPTYDSLLIRQDCLARFGERAIVSQLSQVYDTINLLSQSHEWSKT